MSKRFLALALSCIYALLVTSLVFGADLRKLGSNDLEWGTGTTTSAGGKVVTKINAGILPIPQGDNTLTVGDVLTDVFNVKAYGAVGDGVADDTAAIQAAIDAAKPYCEDDTDYRKGAVVFFPRGNYKVTSPLDASTALQSSENLILRGIGKRGSMITAVLGSAGPVLDLTGQSRARLEHLSIESRDSGSKATALVLIAENAANLAYSNRENVLFDVILNGYSPDIVATLAVYNGDLLLVMDSVVANGVGGDGVSVGTTLIPGVTSPFQTLGTRLDATGYNFIGSGVLGGQAIRLYGGANLYLSNGTFTRIAPAGTDNAIFVLESNTTNAPSFFANSIRTENQTTDNNISLIYSKGAYGISRIFISGVTTLADTDGEMPQGGFIRAVGDLGPVALYVDSDYGDPYMFNVGGGIYGMITGFSRHSAIGTVTGEIRGINFNCNVNDESAFIQSLSGKLLAKGGYVNGVPFFSTYEDPTVMKKIRLNSGGTAFIFEDP